MGGKSNIEDIQRKISNLEDADFISGDQSCPINSDGSLMALGVEH